MLVSIPAYRLEATLPATEEETPPTQTRLRVSEPELLAVLRVLIFNGALEVMARRENHTQRASSLAETLKDSLDQPPPLPESMPEFSTNDYDAPYVLAARMRRYVAGEEVSQEVVLELPSSQVDATLKTLRANGLVALHARRGDPRQLPRLPRESAD